MKAVYKSDRNWRMSVANETAADPKVRGEVAKRAQGVYVATTVSLVGLAASGGAAGEIADEAAGMVVNLPIKQYGRKRRDPRRSLIPVSLIGVNANRSRWLEWGHGPNIRATRFMAVALRSNAKGAAVYTSRRGG